MRAAWAALTLSLAGPCLASDFRLIQPIDCILGDTCFIEDYVDTDPAPDQSRDYTCGLNTRDGHRGIDFALPSFDVLDTGVAVLAAAPGEVLRVRDGMVDDRRMPGVTDQNACGNAVLIQHQDGFQTLYCHLLRGSLRVAPGDRIAAGDPLGLVGLSGQTTHPHLHFTLLRDGAVTDPFQPTTTAACDAGGPSLWDVTPPYYRTLIRLAGFSDAVPGYDALRSGAARRDLAAPEDPLVVYAEIGFAQDGDQLTIRADGPDGQIFSDTRVLDTPQVSHLPAYGRRAPSGGWPEGEYTGQLTLVRDGVLIANRFAHITVAR